MEALALAVQQGRSELALERAESDRLEPRRAAAIAENAADVLAAHNFSAHHAQIGKREAWLGIAAAEGAEPFQQIEYFILPLS